MTKPPASIARHRGQTADPHAFDALRLQAVTAAQQASGELWTDYNLHDPGVSLLEALCFALTEDLFAARQPVPQLLGLDPQADAAAWARFGLHTPQAVLPCHPCTDRDWQSWLLQQLPHGRHLHMEAMLDARGRANGLWKMALQGHSDAAAERHALRAQALQAYWPRRNLGEDLDGAPQVLHPRWVLLEMELQLEGYRDVCELLVEVLQRCDDCLAARLPDGLPAPVAVDPGVDGPLGRPLTGAEAFLLEHDPQFVFVSDLARHLQGVRGLAAVGTLRLKLAQGEVIDPADDDPAPPGAVRRRGRSWALRLRWPEHEAQLAGWKLLREGAPVQVPARALLQTLRERRHVPLRLATSAVASPAEPPPSLPPLPALRHDYYAASAALPPLYLHALREQARNRPGLAAQWQGYLALLEQGLNQVQAQREQLPRLYALDDDGARSYWTSLPGDEQLPGVDGLYLAPRAQLESAPWVDEDRLSRRHRVLDYQLALHGEGLEHAGLQGLPCYFTPRGWSGHLLRLKRQFARRLLRLGQQRGAGANLSQPVVGDPDNTPPLQERLALMLGLAQPRDRWLSGSWRNRRLPAPSESSGRAGAGERDARIAQRAPAGAVSLLDPVADRRAIDWPRLRGALPILRDALPAPLLRAAVRPEAFTWTPDAGGQLWLGPDDQGRHWRLDSGMPLARAREHGQALHEAACELQAAGEGMHLVEHVLLRPLGPDGHGEPVPACEDDAQVTLVFTGWTARGADPRFRALAEQMLAREAPAHLRCRMAWLGARRMAIFETAWMAWLAARRAHDQALLADTRADVERAAVARLDRRSRRLRAFLRKVCA